MILIFLTETSVKVFFSMNYGKFKQEDKFHCNEVTIVYKLLEINSPCSVLENLIEINSMGLSFQISHHGQMYQKVVLVVPAERYITLYVSPFKNFPGE